jgi:signal transduction histidine kinase
MYGGGMVINERTAQIIRYAGVIVPITLAFYGVLVQYGIVDTSHNVPGAFVIIMIPWLLGAIWQFLYPSKNALTSAIRLVGYHVLGAGYVFFVSGFTAPFLTSWVLLFLASYAYFSQKGLRFSVIVLILVAATDSLLHINNSSIILTNLMSVTTVLIVGLAAVAISKVQEISGVELSRSKAQELLQRDRIMTIINNLADAVLATDETGVIRVYNAASLNLLDTNTSLNGHHIDEVLSLSGPKDQPFELYNVLRKSRGVVVRDDLTMSIAGETLRLEVTYSPIRSGYSADKKSASNDGYVLILRDITKAKSLEEERDEFISVISHELRTPITIAEGTISNVQLMMKTPNIAPSVLEQGIAMAHDQVVFLSKMVSDLSTLSRAERGVADTAEPIDVRAFVNDLYNEYAPQAKKNGLGFDLDLSPRLGQVTASKLYLKELVQNFINNALKYTKQGSITLRVTRSGNKITFEVKDTGIGISKSDQAKVFNKFYRSEDYRTRETGGTGLGLYVSAKLAKKLGTKIQLNSRLNHGSSFSFSLPVEDK